MLADHYDKKYSVLKVKMNLTFHTINNVIEGRYFGLNRYALGLVR